MNTETKTALTSAIITSAVASIALFGVPHSAWAQNNGTGGNPPPAQNNPPPNPNNPTAPPPGAPSQPGTPLPTGPAGGNGTPTNVPGAAPANAPGVTPGTSPAATPGTAPGVTPTNTAPATPAPTVNANDPALALRGVAPRTTAPVGSATRAGRTGYGVSAYGSAASQLLPSSVQEVMARVADLRDKAQYRQRYAPSGARQSYRAAEAALLSVLTTAKVSPVTSGAAQTANNAGDASLSSAQMTEDIRALRDAARTSAPARGNMLRRVAAYYATGSKEFFTAQLREALLEPKAQKILIRSNAKVGDSIALASSAILPAPSSETIVAPPIVEDTVTTAPPNVAANTQNYVPVSPGLYVNPGYGSQNITPGVILTSGYGAFNSNYPIFPVVTVSPGFNNFGSFGSFGTFGNSSFGGYAFP